MDQISQAIMTLGFMGVGWGCCIAFMSAGIMLSQAFEEEIDAFFGRRWEADRQRYINQRKLAVVRAEKVIADAIAEGIIH